MRYSLERSWEREGSVRITTICPISKSAQLQSLVKKTQGKTPLALNFHIYVKHRRMFGTGAKWSTLKAGNTTCLEHKIGLLLGYGCCVSFNALVLCTSSSLKQNFVFMGFSSNRDALSQSVDFHRQHVSTCDWRLVKTEQVFISCSAELTVAFDSIVGKISSDGFCQLNSLLPVFSWIQELAL